MRTSPPGEFSWYFSVPPVYSVLSVLEEVELRFFG